MPTATEVQETVEQLVVDRALLHDFVHGDDETSITTENGPVDSLAKMQKGIVEGAYTEAAEGAEALIDSAKNTALTAIAGQQSTSLAAINTAKTDAIAEIEGLIDDAPVGAAFLLLSEPPGDNRGDVGDSALNQTDGVLYPKKTADGWTGVKLSDGSTVIHDGQIDDLALGTLPSGITTTRGQSTTNLLSGDAGTDYDVIASGTAVQHPLLGLLSFPQSKQFAPDPTGPGDGTITPTDSFQVGKVCVRIHGNGTLASTAGTATGSGYGAITEASGDQTLVLSSTGTIAFSLSGSDANTQVQIEQSPIFPTTTVPTPFMPTAGTRDADRIANTGDLKNALGASEGTVIFKVRVPVNKTNNTILGVNTSTALLQATKNQELQWFDGSNFQTIVTGIGDFRNGCYVGMTWRSGRIAFMTGSRVPHQFASTLLSITAARLGSGAATTDLYGQASLAGGIERYRLIDRATVTSGGDAMEFYDLVSEIKRPTVADFQNWGTVDPLPILNGKLAQLAAGTITSVPIVCTGPSHTAGITGFSNSWPKLMADKLAAKTGLPFHTRAFFGPNNNSLWASGTNPYDGRATYSGPKPLNYGKSLGGECIRLSNGTALNLAWDAPATKIIVPYYTDTGRGSFTVDAGSGPITPDEGGSSSVSTNAALGIAYKTFSFPSGSTSWTISSTGTNDIAGLYDPNGIPVINGGRGGFTAVDMSNSILAPQSSYLLALSVIPNLGLVIVAPDNTNSSNPSSPVSLSAYRTAVRAQFDYIIECGCDVIAMNDPMSATGIIPEGTQQVYAGVIAQEAKRKGLPMFNLRKWQEAYSYIATHNSGFYFENNINSGLHFATIANNWLIAEPYSDVIAAAIAV